MASSIVDTWANTTVLIDNGWGGRGSGFLVQRKMSSEVSKVFLVTNKHVLDPDTSTRQNLTEVTLHMNIEQNGNIVGQAFTYPLHFKGESLVQGHVEDEIDISAIDVTYLFEARPQVVFKVATYDLIADETSLREHRVTAGDEVLVVGYPLGLKQGATNYPLVRQGIIATRIGELLIEELPNNDHRGTSRIIRGFLIDGATIPGSSGSPVVLKQNYGRYLNNQFLIGESAPPLLLGVLTETRFAPVKSRTGEIQSFAGLGMALDAVTVRETIEQFFSQPSM